MKRIIFILGLSVSIGLLVLYGIYYLCYREHATWPDHADPEIVGYVPNERTAIKIAEALWLPLYGDNIYEFRPFHATLQDSVWVISGTIPRHARGGVPYLEIRRTDCKVIRLYHTK